MKKTLLLTGALLMLFYCQKEATKEEVVNYGSSITQDELKEHLYIYASDEFEGRDTGDPGQKKAVNYIKEHYEALGIKPVIEGLDLIRQSIISVLDRFGIKKIEAMEQKFDHNFHQAMIEIERDDCEPGIVVQELIPGYTLHDRLLRPSMVGVSKKKTDNTDDKSS